MSSGTDAGGGPRVAVLARRGKFLVAEPFFGAGPRLVVSRDSRYDVDGRDCTAGNLSPSMFELILNIV